MESDAQLPTQSWELDYTKRNGDGKITWGPDAELTPLGESQALVSPKYVRKALLADHADAPARQSKQDGSETSPSARPCPKPGCVAP